MNALVTPMVEGVHAAMDTDSLLDSIEDSLKGLELGGQFAIFFHDKAKGCFNLANARNIPESCFSDYTVLVQSGFPFQDLSYRMLGSDTSVVCCNLIFQGQAYGAIVIPTSPGLARSVSDVDIESYLRSVGTALVKLQIFEEASRNSLISKSKIDAVNHVAELLNNLELDQLLASLLEISLEIMKAQVGSIVLREKSGELKSGTELGLREEFLLGLASAEGVPFIESVIDAGEPVLIQQTDVDARLDTSEISEQLRSIICLPLLTVDNMLGVLVIINTDGDFATNDFDVLTTIGFLASSAIENAMLRIEQAEADRARAQMNLARKIQQNMQAKRVPQIDQYDLDGWCIPCDETGGDYYDFIDYRPGQLCVVVGDATGHGIAAALTMVAVRASLLSMLQLDYRLTDVMRYVGNRIEADGNTDRFMTLFCGVLDLSHKSLTYCSAGHDNPILYRPRTDEIRELEATGIPLGTFADWDYELCEGIQLEIDDILVISTDGVREAFNREGEIFGDDRFIQMIRESKGLNAAQIGMKIRTTVLDFIDPAPRTDDITVVVLVVR